MTLKKIYKKPLFIASILINSLLFFLPVDVFALEIIDTYNKIIESGENIYNFVKNMYYLFYTITSILGMQVIIMLILIGLISSALKNIGIEKGKFSFFISIILSDIIWYIGLVSFKYTFFEIAISIIKTNCIIALPYFIINLYKKNKFNVKNKILNIFKSKNKKFTKKILLPLLSDITSEYNHFQNNVIKDLYYSIDNEILISNNTKKSIDKLINFLLILKNGDNK